MMGVVTVIGDIVESRKKADRSGAQKNVEAALQRTNDSVRTVHPLASTVGDEFQGTFASVSDAVRATLMVRLFLPAGIDCRFGIGRGETTPLPSVSAQIEDGSAWWSARSAIIEVKNREARSNRNLRTWFVPSARDGSGAEVINAFLLCRDELISRLDGRGKRILLGTIEGKTQTEIARQEGITQSAVSQSMARNGAYAILTSSELVERMALDVDRSTGVPERRPE